MIELFDIFRIKCIEYDEIWKYNREEIILKIRTTGNDLIISSVKD